MKQGTTILRDDGRIVQHKRRYDIGSTKALPYRRKGVILTAFPLRGRWHAQICLNTQIKCNARDG